MRSIIKSVIRKKTDKKSLITESNHILERISKDGIDSILKDEKEIKRTQ